LLSRLLGVSLSSTRYHVFNLEKDGEIVFWKEGEYLRAYPPSVDDERSMRIYALLQQKAARKILRVLLKANRGGNQGWTNNEISRITRLSQSTVSEYLSEFRELSLARKNITKEGRMVSEIAGVDRVRISSILGTFESNLVSGITDNYIALWDF